jgi:hypothetical protein
MRNMINWIRVSVLLFLLFLPANSVMAGGVGIYDDDGRVVAELRNSSGRFAGRNYHLEITSETLNKQCEYLAGKILIYDRDKKQIAMPYTDTDNAYQYDLHFYRAGDICRVKINDNGVFKQRFIQSNRTSLEITNDNAEITRRDRIRKNIDFANIAILARKFSATFLMEIYPLRANKNY